MLRLRAAVGRLLVAADQLLTSAGRLFWLAGRSPFVLVSCGALCIVAWANVGPGLAHYRDGPPLEHTGGFGEQTCHACHFGSEMNEPPGVLEIDGLPDSLKPGSTYVLEIIVAHPELVAAGFEVAIRDTSGEQFGQLAPVGPGEQSGTSPSGVQYVFHNLTGSTPPGAGKARWTVSWTTPGAPPETTVIRHSDDPGNPEAPWPDSLNRADSGAKTRLSDAVISVAANAANGDNSEFGDRVYQKTVVVPAHR